MEERNDLNEERLERALRSLGADSGDVALHPPVNDLTRRRVADAVLNEHANRSAQTRRRSSQVPVVVFAVAAALVLAVAALLWRSAGHEELSVASNPVLTSSRPESVFVPRSRITLLQGNVRYGQGQTTLGGSVPTDAWIETGEGHSAFSLPTGIAVGLSQNTSVRVSWDGRRGYGVEINEGMSLFSVDPQQVRDGFHVKTSEGIVRVTGTLFTVVVSPEGVVSVHLHKGTVTIEKNGSRGAALTAGQMAILSKSGQSTGPDDNTLEVSRHMRRLGCMDDRIFTEFDPSACDVDTSVEESVEAGKPASAIERRPVVRSSRSAAELLATAREARVKGRHGEAAVALEELIATWPDTADGRTALVTLGQIELKKLGRPAEARRHFSKYLQKKGPLVQDALIGQAAACRALNDVDGERKALAQIVRDFPGGPADAAARRRLADISRQ